MKRLIVLLLIAVTLSAAEKEDAAAHYRLAMSYGQSAASAGMFEAMSLGKKMRAELERAIELDPNFIPARMALLEFHCTVPAMFGGSEEIAAQQAAEIRKRDAMEGHRAFARIYTAAKKPELAHQEYVAMVREQPRSARAHYLFAVHLLGGEKKYAAAAAELETAVQLDAAYMPAYFRIGHAAALGGGTFARGEEALKKYLAYTPKEDEPSLARAHYWLGMIYEKSGRVAQAKASYAASLKINANQKDAEEAWRRVR